MGDNTAERQHDKDQNEPPSPTSHILEKASTATASTTQTSTLNTVTKTVLARHSTRVFHSTPVPLSIIEECLTYSQRAPSSTNLQPWRLAFSSGKSLDTMRRKLTSAVEAGVPSKVPPIPDSYKHFRKELGHEVYGEHGYNIPHSDKAASKKAQMRNFSFFDAPLVAVVGIESILSPADIMSVGLYLQTFLLLLTERGLGTCVEVSTAGYPEVIKEVLGISEGITILCTVAIGYEDEEQHINKLKMPREGWRTSVKFID